MGKQKRITEGPPFDTLMRGLAQVPKHEFRDEENKFKAARKAQRAK